VLLFTILDCLVEMAIKSMIYSYNKTIPFVNKV
jgi:hypothetical protein